MSKLLLTFLTCFTYISIQAQTTGYNIRFNIEDCQPGNVILAYYYGNKQYIKDSTRVDQSGTFSFTGTEPLDQGIYIVVLPPDNKYFEVAVDADQDFLMSTKYQSPVQSMKVEGSEENERFYNYLQFLNTQKKKSEPLAAEIKTLQAADSTGFKETPKFKELQAEMSAIDAEVKAYKNNFIENHPDALMSKVFLASKDPEVPEPPVAADGSVDSTFAWRYFKNHYWDNVDFTDDRILRTPVYHNKLERFMTQTIYQIPDSVIKEATLLVNKTLKNKELFKYTVFWITSHFETSKQMGMDAVFVHMAQNYYMTGQAFWADSTTIAKIGERAQKLSYSLIGNVAPNLIMHDSVGKVEILHAIPADYTIAYFWDPTCGHCKKVTPKVKEFYDKFKKELNVEVFAVNANAKERNEWIKYIQEHNLDWINVEDPEQKTAYKYLYDLYSTPVIYLLDKDKKIIAKRIGAEDLENFIRHHKKKSS